jgi:hypothetical protein
LKVAEEAATDVSEMCLLSALFLLRFLSSTSQPYSNFASLEEIMKNNINFMK